jgi:DNA polymerase I
MPSTPQPLVLLVDGYAVIHRAYHAIPPLSTAKGEPTNALFGFALMLLRALTDLKPDYVAVALDRPGPTFRHLEYEAYKAQRPPAPDDLRQQFNRLRDLVRVLGVRSYELEGFEADDLIGTLARSAESRGWRVIIATGDADALQLVTESTSVLTPVRGFSETVTYGPEGVRERYGIDPVQLPDYKALNGDPSDNIKGVPGIGQKTASKLLAQYGTVERLLEAVSELPERTRIALSTHAEEARQGKRLATIVTDSPVEIDWEECHAGRYDRDEAVALFRELDFRSLLARLPGSPPPDAVPTGLPVQTAMFADDAKTEGIQLSSPGRVQGDYKVVDTPAKLAALVADIDAGKALAIDTETTGVNAMRAVLVGISLSVKPESAYYVPVGHYTNEPQLPLDAVVGALGPAFSRASLPKVGHNIKYDMLVLDRHGLPLQGIRYDTMIATYLIESSQRALNLKDVAFDKLGTEMTHIVDLIGKGKSQSTMASVPVGTAADYACADADVTLRLMRKTEPELRSGGLDRLFADVEMPLVAILAQMEQDGVAIDSEYLRAMSVKLGEQLADIEDRIYASVGHRFNTNSTKQLATVLFDELGLASNRRTKTGYSTDADTLELLRGAHPVIELILESRQLGKLKSTYVDALPAMVNPSTGRLHTSYNQTAASTGRISSSDPNLQNIPIRTPVGREVRRSFIAEKVGWSLLSADYSQVELRILAHVTQDANLVDAFTNGEDIHSATASLLFNVPLPEVTSDQRRIAKTTNFGIIYGISDFGLSQQLSIPRAEAAEFIRQYFARYPTVREYLNRTITQARTDGYVTTLLGRRRFIPEIHAPNQQIRSQAERAAINMPIQGTAADIIKIAMVRLSASLRERGFQSRMILQVHDELLLECPDDELAVVRPIVVDTMEQAMTLLTPLKVDSKVGRNWRDME